MSDKSVESHKGVFFYVNEMTFGKHLRMGLVASGTNHVIRGLRHSVLAPDRSWLMARKIQNLKFQVLGLWKCVCIQ